MRKYRSTFRQADGAPFPPDRVKAQIIKGRLYTYFREGGPDRKIHVITGARLVRVGVVELSPGWWDQYFSLKHGRPLPAAEGAEIEKGRALPGSWDALINDYTQTNRRWLGMAEETQSGYRTYLRKIASILGPHKVAKTQPEQIEALILKKQFGVPGDDEQKAAPMGARMLRQVFSLLCEHARKKLKWIDQNPVRDIEKPKSANPDGHRTWAEAGVSAWRETYPYANPDGTACMARRFLELALAWGPRAGDLLDLGWKNIEAGEISFKPKKTRNSTGAVVHLAVDNIAEDREHLLAVLALCPRDEKFFFQKPPRGMNQYNRHKLVALIPEPWSYTRLRKSVRDWRAAAGLPEDCTSHGLRKLFATRMANRGVDLQDIADALGDTIDSARIYVAARNKRAGSLRATASAA